MPWPLLAMSFKSFNMLFLGWYFMGWFDGAPYEGQATVRQSPALEEGGLGVNRGGLPTALCKSYLSIGSMMSP